MQNKPFFSHKHGVPKQGGGGVPHLGKILTFSRFFSANVPYFPDYISRSKKELQVICVWNKTKQTICLCGNFSIFLPSDTMVTILQEVCLFLGGWKGLWCLQLIDFPCQCGEWDVKYSVYRMPPRKKAMDDAAELLELGELPGGANDGQGGMMEFVRWLAM